MRWLEDQVALVLGGGSGIGSGVVEAFVDEGARVVVFDRVPDRAHAIGNAYGKDALAVAGDATDPVDCERALRVAVDSYGKVDTLVCCVGLFDFYAGMDELSGARLGPAFDEAFAVNVKTALLGADAALPELRRNKGSLILTVSSAAFRAGGGGVLYGATKWAVRGLVAYLARDLAPEVRVNGVAPGGTTGTRLAGLRSLEQGATAVDEVSGRDERIRASNVLGALFEPRDHAAAYVYLASKERARAVTGTIINTDGGTTL